MRLNLNDLRYIIHESYNRLMLLEISNNAIETLLKKYNPDIVDLMDFTLGELNSSDIYINDIDGAFLLRVIGVDTSIIKSSPNMKIKDYLRLKILKEFDINRGNGPIKYLRGIIRISCDEREGINIFNAYNLDKTALKKFKNIVSFIHTNNLEFDEDLNGLSLIQLNRIVGSKMRIVAYQNWLNGRDMKADSQEVYGEYTVIPIHNYDEASIYSKYTSWCVTQSETAFNQYTSDGSRFFFCLKKGFEDIKRPETTETPLDEYGLSMVSVLVHPNGVAKHVTTRYNHAYNGEDNLNLKTLEQVEDILGIPKSMFLNYITPEMEIDDLNELLKHGIDISHLIKRSKQVGDITIVEYKNMYNAMKNDKMLLDNWYDNYITIQNGLILFRRYADNEGIVFNACDERGKIFPTDIKYKIDNIFDSESNVFIVTNSRMEYNLLRRGSSEFILPQDVRRISNFKYGYAVVETFEGYTNLLDKSLSYLWDEPVRMKSAYFHTSSVKDSKVWKEGMLIMQNAYGNETYMDVETRQPITDQWFNECFSFENGVGKVLNNRQEENLIKRDGTLVCDNWFYKIEKLTNHNYVRGETYDEGDILLDMNGIPVIDKYWERIFDFNGKYGAAKKRGKIVFFDNKGNELFSVDGWVALVLDNMFLVLTPSTLIYDNTGKMISDNLTFLDEKTGITLPDGYWSCIDNNTKVCYLYNVQRDKMLTFNNIEEVKKYIK